MLICLILVFSTLFTVISYEEVFDLSKIDEENDFKMVKSCNIIRRFLRQVTIPDKFILRKPLVGPENTEGKYQDSHIMNMISSDIFKISQTFKKPDKQCNECKRGYKHPY